MKMIGTREVGIGLPIYIRQCWRYGWIVKSV